MRAVVLAALLAAGGCQCLEPVDEASFSAFEDGGGRDAGTDAGLARPVRCEVASDCMGTPRVTGWCARYVPGLDAGFSCVDGQCVAGCGDQAGQRCAQDVGVECLRCPPTASCLPPSCTAAFNLTFRVEDIACDGPPPLAVGDQLSAGRRDAGCGAPWSFVRADGGEEYLGDVYSQSTRGFTSARIELLGGLCLISEMPTGALRLLLDCPRCQVALGP
jgi:hypothetical protein